jgi:NAD(P)-dependent dehydrogenase (short-subunit alcohol dehydrogenase family)
LKAGQRGIADGKAISFYEIGDGIMGQVAGKIALVTGGGEGIGKASALTLGREGAKVAVTDINEDTAAQTAAEIVAAGGDAMAMQHDVTEEARWQDVVAAVEEKWGGLQVLLNNAGIAIVADTVTMSLEDWRKQTAVNIDGVFLGVKYAIPAMRRAGKGGSIINLSSVAGLRGAPGLSGYAATKGAVKLFTKSVALECARNGDNIRVNSVHPGIIETNIWPRMSGGGNEMNPVAIGERSVPLGASAGPQVIADGVLFLASENSAYMTGSELVIDGGLTAGTMSSRPVNG